MRKFLALFGAMTVTSPVWAVIDVTAATTAISDGETAVLSILTALIAAYGAFLGLRMVKSVMRRGG